MKFNLMTKELYSIKEDTIIKSEIEVMKNSSEEIEMKTFFGINCVCF